MTSLNTHEIIKTGHNSTYPKGGFTCSKGRFVVTETFVLLINICAENSLLSLTALDNGNLLIMNK
jgi:hypothetical protein